MNDTLIVVPARAQSKGLPGKNLATVAGVSLVGRAVIQGREFVARAGLAARARVVVDTDGDLIAEEGRRWGAEVPFLRPPEFARDTTPTAQSVIHLWERLGRTADTIVLLQPTSPLRSASDVLAVWQARTAAGALSAISIRAVPHPLSLALGQTPAGRLDWVSGGPPESSRRQDEAPTSWPTGAVYVVDSERLESDRQFILGGDCVGVLTPEWCSVDVDTASDLSLARLLAWHRTPPAWDQHMRQAGEVDSSEVDEVPLILRAQDRLEQTVELLLRAIGRGQPPRAVVFGRNDVEAVLDMIAVRSLFDVAVCWDTRTIDPTVTERALIAGVSSWVGSIPEESVRRARFSRALANDDAMLI